MSLSVVTPLWQDRPAIENLEVATNAERLGYPELWIGEMATFDAFAFATAVASRPGDMTINVGPLAVSIRTPVSMAMGIASVGELCGRNARLAIGTSSTVVVERWHGRSRSRPAKRLEEAAMVLNGLLDGEKVDFAGELTRCAGYRMRLDTAGADVTVAAFGPAAIRVAARHGSRMLLNMVTPKTLSRLKEALAAEARAAGRPEPPLAVWLACAVDPDEAAIAQIMRAKVGYIAAPVTSRRRVTERCSWRRGTRISSLSLGAERIRVRCSRRCRNR